MKRIFTIILAVLLINTLSIAQDTLYMYQNGSVVGKRAIAEIDSVTFYKVPDASVLPSIEFNGTLYVYPTDNSAAIQWCEGSCTTTGATSLTDGEANTIAIITNQGAGSYAAQLCADLNSLGFDDWYLPSIDELNALYLNRNTIGGFGGTNLYWSSSEFEYDTAWKLYFADGYQSEYLKVSVLKVRCVRR